MGQSIKISEKEMELLRTEAELSSRSVAGQVTHWLRIGRAIERSADFNYTHIRQALEARRGPDTLAAEEQAVYIESLMDAASEATREQIAFFKQRRQDGLGVGTDKASKIVRQKKKSKRV
jgi:hypothetical protein